MPVAPVTIHSSQFPENVRRDLIESLRRREVNHKFHYDSVRQTQKWLQLHQAFSPSRNDADCAATYDRAFAAAAAQIADRQVQLIGLGCGGGQKDSRLLQLLKAGGAEVSYVPCDVSTAMVLVARQTALAAVAEQNCFPFVCDLASATDLPEMFEKQFATGATRLITFFGMIPNFEPQNILPKLASLVRPGDRLLFSANLAPGPDYAAGVRRILPQYDNALTREWLIAFLLDLGVERGDGEMRFGIEEHPAGSGLQRITAAFHFSRDCKAEVDSERFEFKPGESIRLFFSYRYAPSPIERLLNEQGLRVLDRWVTASEEEGVFLTSRGPA